jgi:hypothetical protein
VGFSGLMGMLARPGTVPGPGPGADCTLRWPGAHMVDLESGRGLPVYSRDMEQTEASTDLAWVPQACTLPMAEQPLRVAAFDRLLGEAVQGIERVAATRLHLDLRPEPEVAGRAAELAAAETKCCSFFTFTLTMAGGAVGLDVAVPPGHVGVLDALAERARCAR